MTPDEHGTNGRRAPAAVYDALAAATPAERAALLRRLVTEQPEIPLALPTRDDGSHAMLDGVDLGRTVRKRRRAGGPTERRRPISETPPVSLRGADLRGARLRSARLAGIDLGDADLRDAALGAADLRGAVLSQADLRGADLAGARLGGAALGGADLRGAMLEDADLRGAGLRFAKLDGAALEQARLRTADLWGACLCGAELRNADLRGAVLREADLQRADLTHADLRGAACAGANLADAVLTGARLQGLDLTACDIARVHVSGTWLENARLRRAQLGGAVGEEIDRDYAGARDAYLVLERAFGSLGDHDAASWAYRRRRRMEKRCAWQRAHATNSWRSAGAYLEYASDVLSEWVCDYGESIPRVLASILALYLAFTVIYGLTGSVVRVVETPAGAAQVVTRDPIDLAVFSLLAMSTSGSPSVGLLPRDESVYLLTATEALFGIGLTGLLGFVLGNRVRR